MGSSIQIQSILYKNEKDALKRAMDNLVNALRVDGGAHVSSATLLWGDASPKPLFTPEEITALREACDGRLDIRYTFFKENTGTSKGHNRLFQCANAEYVMVMNPDVVVNPRIFEQMLRPFQDEKVALTEARQTPIEHHKEYDIKTGETSWACTACVMISRWAYEELDGFDEKTFFMYCDDLDFSWRLRLKGYKVIYVPSAVVFHDKSLSAKGEWQPTYAERYYSAEAAVLMAHKWSNLEREAYLMKLFDNEKDEIGKKVVSEIRKRMREGRMPEPIDAEHKVAEFVGDDFGKSRFKM